MNKLYAVLSGLALLAISALTNPVSAQTVHPDYVDGQIWVKVRNDYPLKVTEGAMNMHNLPLDYLGFVPGLPETADVVKLSRPYYMTSDEKLRNVYRIEFNNPHMVDYLLRHLKLNPAVDYAEKIPLSRHCLTPNDPQFNGSNQWSLFQIQATTAWNIGTGSANIVVAIVDDAVEITHSDLQPAIWVNTGEIANNGQDDDGNGYVDDRNGYDVANMDNNPGPDAPASSYDHGTHVAGIAGAATNNATGMASIGFGVKLMAVKSTNSATAVTHGYDGIVYAVESGADVINMSWGGSGSSTTAQNIINYAYNQGIVLIAAAGNDNVSSPFYPANYNHVVAVASTTTGDVKSSFSNYGNWIDVSAPGSGIYSTIPGNSYGIKQGTSMASPLVAGLAGLILSQHPGLPVDDVVNCILSTADNIDAANPTFIGQLGAGRINAFAALNCVTSTLAYAPVADFSVDLSVILAGQSVNFTDLSYYNPTTWSWTFTGGTPATFTGQTPPAITYNTAGTYPVTLTVTNANGNDTETKTGYITVNGLTGCDTISNTITTDQIYTWSYGGGNGYLAGHTGYGMTKWADRYSAYGPTWVTGASFYFTEGETNNPNAFITVEVWNEAAGMPGTSLYQEQIKLTEIETNAAGPGGGQFYITDVEFDMPVQVTGANFYVGYTLSYAAGDTVACALTDNLNATARPNTMVCYLPAGNPLSAPAGWYEYTALSSTSKFSMHVYPRITQTPPVAVITNTPTTGCVGDFMNFNGTGSTNGVTFEWAINGTNTPYPTGPTPSVLMVAPGTHTVYMAAYNSCGFYHIDSIDVTIIAKPTVTVAASGSTTICPGNSITLTASGATTYSWLPGGQTTAGVTVSPATNTTYSVTGTANGCSSDAVIDVTVYDQPPVAEIIANDTTICEGQSISFTGATSQNASTYSWTFTGGDISSSTAVNPSVSYATQGTYAANLTVDNICSQTDNATINVTVEPAINCSGVGIEEQGVSAVGVWINPQDDMVNISFPSSLNGVVIEISNALGQRVSKLNRGTVGSGQREYISLQEFSAGVYFVTVRSGEQMKTVRVVR
jgi:PKD repeat protein